MDKQLSVSQLPDGETLVAREAAKPPFVAPRLVFVAPKLEERGDLLEVTRGFFGPFSP